MQKSSVSLAIKVSLFAKLSDLAVAMAINTIEPGYALFVVQALGELKLTDHALFADTQLNRNILSRGLPIAMDDFIQLLVNARQSPLGEQLGLLIGRRTNILVLGAVGNAAAAAPTLREGLQALESFTRLHVSYIRIAVKSHLNGITIGIKFLQPLRDTERFHLESALCLLQHYVEMLTGTDLTEARYYVPYAKPDYVAQYHQYLHSPLVYEAPATTIELPRAMLDQPSAFHNHDIWQQSQYQLSQSLNALSAQAESPYTQHLLALLNTQEPPLPKLSDIAKQMHVSERTLNRRLLAENTSFRQLKSDVTHQWARQYLSDSNLSVEAIASLLGYQDTANFRRAFRKQQLCTPQMFRDEHLARNTP